MDRRISQALVTATLLTVAVFSSTAAISDEQKPRVIEPDTVIAGRTFGEWSAAWWQWALSIPVSSHPLFDKGGCTAGQTGKVFFLGGKFCITGDTTCNASTAKRQCTVPAGKNLFFPIVNTVGTFPDFKAGDTINTFRKVNQDGIDGTAKLEADLDGRRIEDLRAFRIQSSVFGFTLPDDNVFTALGQPEPAGAFFPAVDEGVYLMLKPLSPGPHLLHFTASFPAFSFAFDITYQLKVSP